MTMAKLGDDYILRSEVEYSIMGTIALLIIPCVIFNAFIIMKILKQNEYRVFNIVPKTVNLYYNIAISDFLMGVFAMPWVIYYIMIGRPAPIAGALEIDEEFRTRISDSHARYHNKTAHRVMCIVSGYSYNVLIRVTSLTVLLLSIDRTHAIYFPLTYGRSFYYSVYKYCIYIIWAFALGIQALPFLAGIPYVEQIPRELMCSWSIIELLGVPLDGVLEHGLQIFFPYFILVDIPLLIPTTTSVFLSFAVLFKIMHKRYQYITEKQNQVAILSSAHRLKTYNIFRKFRAAIMLTGEGESHKIKSLTRASSTMLIIVLTYTIFFSYTWFICIANSLVLLGVRLSMFEQMFTDPIWVYINNSFHITVFFQSAFTPFIVYYRVISNFTKPNANATSAAATMKKSDLTGNNHNVHKNKLKALKLKMGARRNSKTKSNCDVTVSHQNERAQKFV